MNETGTSTGGTEPPSEQTGEPLPPYSGELTTCVKCSHTEASTAYQRECTTRLIEQNNHIDVRGPLPERLQRACQRCGFEWYEALAPSPVAPPATVEDIAYALRFVAPGLFGRDSLITATRLHWLFAMTLRPETWTLADGAWILRDQEPDASPAPAPAVTAATTPPFTITDHHASSTPPTHALDAEQ